jgi:hypothetical protein
MSYAPRRYRKKPVVIEAMRLGDTPTSVIAVYRWIEENTQGSFDPVDDELPASGVPIDPATGFMLIATLEDVMQAKTGDYIIRGVQGEFYLCKPDIFEETYELVAGAVISPKSQTGDDVKALIAEARGRSFFENFNAEQDVYQWAKIARGLADALESLTAPATDDEREAPGAPER